MHEIRDLSDLISLLTEMPGTPLQLSIHPDVQESLAGCLELGLNNVVSFHRMALPPRALMQVTGLEGSPTRKAHPKDFKKYLSDASRVDLSLISVSSKLLEEGLDWLSDFPPGERFAAIQSGIRELTKVEGRCRVEVPSGHVQEVVDWLDMIQRNRPNDLADDLREDVKSHNQVVLSAKIGEPSRYR